MGRKRRQWVKAVRALVVTGLPPMARLTSWEIALVRDRIEAIVLDAERAPASPEVRDAR